MPSKRRGKPSGKPTPKRPSSRPPAPSTRPKASAPARRTGSKPSPARPTPKSPPRSASKGAPKSAPKSAPKAAAPKEPIPELEVPLPGGRHHVLSLSFVRDGDEFLARLETDGGHITELKNRSLDQLLTLVAGELEDLLA